MRTRIEWIIPIALLGDACRGVTDITIDLSSRRDAAVAAPLPSPDPVVDTPFSVPPDSGVMDAPVADVGVADVGELAVLFPDAGMAEPDAEVPDADIVMPQQATSTTGAAIVAVRSAVLRASGDLVEVSGETILYLAQRNRVWVYATVANASDGWMEIDLALCADDGRKLVVVDPSDEMPDVDPAGTDGPSCRWMYDQTVGMLLDRGVTQELLVGSAMPRPHAGGGFLTIRVVARMANGASLPVAEKRIPYRVLPSRP